MTPCIRSTVKLLLKDIARMLIKLVLHDPIFCSFLLNFFGIARIAQSKQVLQNAICTSTCMFFGQFGIYSPI